MEINKVEVEEVPITNQSYSTTSLPSRGLLPNTECCMLIEDENAELCRPIETSHSKVG